MQQRQKSPFFNKGPFYYEYHHNMLPVICLLIPCENDSPNSIKPKTHINFQSTSTLDKTILRIQMDVYKSGHRCIWIRPMLVDSINRVGATCIRRFRTHLYLTVCTFICIRSIALYIVTSTFSFVASFRSGLISYVF